MKKYKIVILGRKGIVTNIVYHSIQKTFGVSSVIIEEKEKTLVFLKRRIKKLGLWTVFGQLLFMIFGVKFLYFISKNRRTEILEENKLDNSDIPSEKIIHVSSINAQETINTLKILNPDLVIVNGTRIISKKVLGAINSKFINTHAGITPQYRGVHGAYWALLKNDKKNCGVTVHYVDAGIDTGEIIYQATIEPKATDNFTTYPLLQIAEGVKILNKAIEDSINNSVNPNVKVGESNLWFHPTIWQYLYYRITQKTK